MRYNISDKGLDHIKKWEGWRSCVYLDVAGVPTIGYGFTWYPDTLQRVTVSDPCITKKQGDSMLRSVLSRFEQGVNEAVTTDISQELYDSLVSIAYNIGLGAFRSSTLLRIVNQDPNDLDAIAAQFARWNKAGGKINKGLKKRRNSEIYHFHPDYGREKEKD